MDPDTPLYNSRLLKTYFDYLAKYYPEVDAEAILAHAGMTRYELDDAGHWFSQKQIDRFQDLLKQKTNNPNIAREVGRYSASAETMGDIRQYIMGFISTSMAYAMVDKMASALTRATNWQTKKLGSNKVELVSIPKKGVTENPQQCANRQGLFEALAKIYTGTLATVEHPTCVNEGGDYCQYIISWKITPAFRWKTISRYTLLLSLFLSIPLFFFLPSSIWAEGMILPILLNMGIFLNVKYIEKKELVDQVTAQSDMAHRLVDEINLRYNEVALIQEIGQAISMILDIDGLLKYIMEALEKRLDFNRGMIMMADKEKKRLTFSVGYGYSPEENDYLSTLSFRLDNPQSKGVAVLTFLQQRPFLIDDVSKIKEDISPKSLEFVYHMQTRSFISVPIIYKGESLGILLVDNPKSERKLSQSDLNLLLGIAPQIAISINNAISYKRIRESEERFRSLSSNSPDIIYTIGNDGSFTYVNPAWERILGHRTEDVIGRFFTQFVKPEDIPLYKQIFKETRDKNRTVRDLTGTILHQNGSERYFSLSAAPNLDAEGKVIGVVGTFKDITDRQLAEEALQYRVELEKLITSISTHFINLSSERINPEINLALKQIGDFARTERSFIFRFIDSGGKVENTHVWTAAGTAPPLSHFEGASAQDLPWFFDKVGRQEVVSIPKVAQLPPEAEVEKNAFLSRGIKSLLCVPMVYGGTLIGFLGFDSSGEERDWSEEIKTLLTIVGEIFAHALERLWVEDEKMKLEEQLRQSQKMEAIGRLAGGVAHDFNNMLTGIIGYADLLLLGLNRDHPLTGKVEEIKKAGKRAASLTQQLLAFSRKQMLQPKVLDLNLVVADLKRMLQRLIGEDISLETQLESGLFRVKVDPNQMGQVLMNLVVNARDAMARGGEITIETANVVLDQAFGRKRGVSLQPGPYVLLEVRDTGTGIDPETRSHIFEPFFTTKELGKGTGLGLSTVYGIIKQSGGYIWVESRPEEGTSFQIFLPQAEGQAVVQEGRPQATSLLQGTETILVVEDNELVRNMTSEALKQYGYRVIEAPGGEQALKVIGGYAEKIDLLLTDVVMPGLNGRELADQILTLRPDIKVLYMSGYADNAIVQYGVIQPGLAFIEKPFSPETLAETIRQIVSSGPPLPRALPTSPGTPASTVPPAG
jgi:PAS domain S-box-containing protein